MLAARDELIFFWCRWPLERPLAVALPDGANEEETALLRRALEAWERAVPGLAFVDSRQAPDIAIRFDESGPEGARASADCAVDAPLPLSGPLPARLVRAEVSLRRGERDAWGRPIRLSEAELLGSVLHEIGHALGVQGHTRLGDSALSRNVDQVRRVGRRVAAGRRLEEAAVAAVYALPSGTLVERRTLAPGTTAAIDVALDSARPGSVELRLGDRFARIRVRASPEVEWWLKDPAEVFKKLVEFEGLLERARERE